MKKAAIVGGSLTGLAAGILLRRVSWDVDIFERSSRSLSDRGAGIVMQPETLELLRLCGATSSDEVGVMLERRKYLGRDGSVLSEQRMPQLMTSWGLLYSRFRTAFPGERYHLEHAGASFEQNGSSVTVLFEHGAATRPELVVAADGFRSAARAKLLPEVRPTYTGYVAWRGVIQERDVSQDIKNIFANCFTFCQMKHSHSLCYFIPGENGETAPGSRRLNWVWYWNVPEADLDELLTDRDGVRRSYAIAPGLLHPRQEERQREIAERVLAPPFVALVRATKEPFVQAILDLACPQMAFGRIALTGDTSFIVRPHTAASTSKGVANAFALADQLADGTDVPGALNNWERSELVRGRELIDLGRRLGNRSQFS
jgi:2-polyprenyl-6-methoxyphenol hydroxylase-like FAD-dependent oxidoreductase